MTNSLDREFRFPALEIKQGPRRTFYVFAVDGKLVDQFATVSRIRRNGAALEGYQRPEVLSHIAEIRAYLESPDPMIPNGVVVAFDTSVRFEPTTGNPPPAGENRIGTVIIPTPSSSRQHPGFVVDGQQRLAAIRDARVGSFPIAVSAFITDDISEQTQQFILVNSTKPLPKGLIYELLPSTAGNLPSHLRRKRFPSMLLDRLNRDGDSPLAERIHTPTTPLGTIKDNSVLRMLENSLSDGVLHRYRLGDPQGTERMLRTLKAYWTAVAEVFSEAWDLPPRRSRLVHGAGILAMGFLMDTIADRHRHEDSLTADLFSTELAPVRDACRWTSGYWDFGPGQQRKWNEVQNTPPDIQLLSNYLLIQYKARVWNAAPSALFPKET